MAIWRLEKCVIREGRYADTMATGVRVATTTSVARVATRVAMVRWLAQTAMPRQCTVRVQGRTTAQPEARGQGAQAATRPWPRHDEQAGAQGG